MSAGGSSSGLTGPTAPDASGQWVQGYYVDYLADSYPLADIDWGGLTHIIYGRIVLGANTAINFTNNSNQTAAIATAKQVSDAAHAHGVKALLMFGGAGENTIGATIQTHLSTLTTNLLSAMTNGGFDGLDLDIEDGTTASGITPLAKALRAAKPDIILTFPGGTVEYGTQVDSGLAELVTYLDRYNQQSYYGGNVGLFTGKGPNNGADYFQSWFPSALSGADEAKPYAVDYAFQKLVAAGIPKAKIGMGISFYAACYLSATNPPSGSPITAPRMPAYNSGSYCWDCGIGGGDNTYPLSVFFAAGSTYDNASAGERLRDSIAKEPYLSLSSAVSDTHCGGSSQYMVYEDETSIIDKGTFSKTNGYGGIIIWTIEEGYLPANASGGRSRNSLMEALKTGFLTP